MPVAYDKVAVLLQVAQGVAGYPALKPIGDAAMIELTAVVDEAQKIVAKAAADKKAADDKAAAEEAAKDKAEADKAAAQEKAMADAREKAKAAPPPLTPKPSPPPVAPAPSPGPFNPTPSGSLTGGS